VNIPTQHMSGALCVSEPPAAALAVKSASNGAVCVDAGAVQNPTTCAAVTDPEGKSFYTLRAALALRGWTLAAGAAGYTVTRWGRGHQLANLTEVEHLARQIGAPL